MCNEEPVDRQSTDRYNRLRCVAVNEALCFFSFSSSLRASLSTTISEASFSLTRRHSTRPLGSAIYEPRSRARCYACEDQWIPVIRAYVVLSRSCTYHENLRKRSNRRRESNISKNMYTTVLFFSSDDECHESRRIVKHEPDCGAARRIMALFTLSAAAPFPTAHAHLLITPLYTSVLSYDPHS